MIGALIVISIIEALIIANFVTGYKRYNQQLDKTLRNGEYIFVEGRIYKCGALIVISIIEALIIANFVTGYKRYNQQLDKTLRNGEYIFVEGRIYKCEYVPDPKKGEE